MNVLRGVFHWIACRNASIWFPTFAQWDHDETHVYPFTCGQCGYVRMIAGPGRLFDSRCVK